MFAAPRERPLLSLTPNAVARLKVQLVDSGSASCVRVGVKKGGCAGMEYTMALVEEPGEHDEVVEQDGICLAILPSATLFLIGTEIDYKTGLLESGFEFRSPNVVESCGCGESVKFSIETFPGSNPD